MKPNQTRRTYNIWRVISKAVSREPTSSFIILWVVLTLKGWWKLWDWKWQKLRPGRNTCIYEFFVILCLSLNCYQTKEWAIQKVLPSYEDTYSDIPYSVRRNFEEWTATTWSKKVIYRWIGLILTQNFQIMLYFSSEI